jgi:hypothetical protein
MLNPSGEKNLLSPGAGCQPHALSERQAAALMLLTMVLVLVEDFKAYTSCYYRPNPA